MKNFLTVASLIATILFASLWYAERQQARTSRRQLESVEQKASVQAEKLEANQRTIDGLKVQRADLNWEVGSLRFQVQALRQTTNLSAFSPKAPTQQDAFGSAAKPNAPTLFSEMLKSPEMKKMMQQQQKVVMDMMYQPLFKELNLTPEEKDEFMAIMQERAMHGVENATALFGNDSATREEALKQMAADHETQDQRLKAVLGDERHAKFTEYSETAGDRISLNQFTNANAVNETQTNQLLDAIKEERRLAMAEAGEQRTGSSQIRDLQAMTSEEELNKQLQRQELVNARVLERAKNILAPEQMEAFGKFQTTQIEMARMTMGIARTMLGAGKSEGGNTPP